MNNQKLIEDNLELVYHIIHRYYPTFIGDEDIVQTGMLGLCKAAEKWDKERGIFSTYACNCIRNEIMNEFRRRKKHKGILSLDYEVTGEDGEKTTFGDLCVGDDDVLYLGIDSCYDALTDKEQEVVELKQQGVSNEEIAKTLNVNIQFVWATMRKLKLLWG